MIELKISGENAEKFFVNAMQTLTMLATAGKGVAPAAAPTSHEDKLSEGLATKSEPLVGEIIPPVAKPKRGAAAKPAPVTIEVPAGKPAVAMPASDDLGATPITQKEIRQRVMDINTKHTERMKAANVPATDVQAKCINFILDLFNKFDIRLANELPQARFGEFMKVSQGYLDGTVQVAS